MKILIVSDIHGYNTYMAKLINIIETEQPDKIIFLGDINYSRIRDDEVFNKLNNFKDKIIAVRGNCDDENDIDCVKFPIYENYIVIKIDNINWYLTHGHLNYKLPNIENNDILFNGHSHCYELSRNYINPGSLSLPRMHSEHTYIIYQNKKFYLYDLDENLIDELEIS